MANKFPFLKISAQVSTVPGYMWKQSIRASNAASEESISLAINISKPIYISH